MKRLVVATLDICMSNLFRRHRLLHSLTLFEALWQLKDLLVTTRHFYADCFRFLPKSWTLTVDCAKFIEFQIGAEQETLEKLYFDRFKVMFR